MFHRLTRGLTGREVIISAAIVEERYSSLRKQVPIVYLLGFVNLSGLELATEGRITLGLNLPTFISL